MQRTLIVFLTLLTLLFPRPAGARGPGQPNIVFIFADDLGWRDVGYQGSDFYETPVIDRFAKEGMVFTHAYAAAGNCAPSRACLLSGTYGPRHGVYAVDSTNRGPKELMRLVPYPNKQGLLEENITLADALKSAGYATGHFGKWHLMHPTEGALPSQQGFDETYDSFGNGPLKEGGEGNQTGPPSDPKGVFTLTNKACAFIEKNKAKPFFVYLAHHGIHSPLQAQPGTLAKFKAKTPGIEQRNAKYAACVAALDSSIDILLKKLKELNLAKNTIVVFTSDNGATQQSSQEPLRGSKGGYYEGGIREPLIVRWPGVTKPGSVCATPVINIDFYPTFLEAAGAKPPKLLDGESLVPLLKGGSTLKRQAIFWHFPGYLNDPVIRGRDKDFRTRPISVIRKGDWKLHLYHEEWVLDGGKNALELYNLKDDIGERSNLADTNPSKRDELLKDLLAWIKSTNAPLAGKKL
ncbi:sulfatase [Armatimonas rosea]|uniref:Arylsulfatase A-like enzyme n=1 Tax=Armatimonas rosea TaxID=685828 RepID=A0A7W9W9T8_ARMRO|nr:sulfatase [Armatimonas rosea]MBB6052892.1 arylsulfatase A-like enzyme [Armatimonas rosea]